MYPMILKLDVGGLPVKWINWQEAAVCYARDRVKWEAGETTFELRGGSRGGRTTILRVNSIIAVADRSRHFEETPRLTNKRLFARDRMTCCYCGQVFNERHLSRDHVKPVSKFGEDRWENVVTACSGKGTNECNARKDDRTPEEAGMPMLYLPYAPSHAEALILASRSVQADQHNFLSAFGSRRPSMRQAH